MVNPVAGSLPKINIDSAEETLIHVLYVDDDAGCLKTAKQILEMQGAFHMETASSVEDAMKKMEEKAFDVIVSDYIMPGKDGLEFLKELRDNQSTIPFIIFTGKGREIVAIKALNLGADQYINKIGKPEAVYSELAHGIRTVVKGKKAEEALRDSEQEKSAVLDSMSELVVHQDLKHRILWVNKKAADSVNMKAEQLMGRHCHELWAESANPCVGCPLEETIKSGQPQQGEIATPDGRVWSINGSPIKDANGNVTSVVEVVTNITEEKNAEEDLRKSEAKYRGLVENIGNGIATINVDGKFVFVNQALCEMIGYSKEELIGKPFADLLHSGDKKRMLQLFSDRWKNPDRKISIEFRVLHKNGNIVHMSSSPTATLYKNKIVGFNAILSDITKRKLAEKALQASEEKYRNVVEQAPDSIMTFDLNGVIASCNAASVALSGYSKDEVLGKHFSELKSLREEDIQKLLKLFDSVLDGKAPEPFEVVYLKEDGASAFGEVHISLMKEVERITGFQAIMRDITERKKAEEALQESEEKFRNLAEKSPNMIFINKKGRVVYANKRCEDIMGYTREEFYSPDFNFFTLIAPQSIELLKSSYSTHLKGEEIIPYEYTLVTKEGKRIEAILTSKLINYDEEPAILGIITDITEHKRVDAELRREKELMEWVTANNAAGLAIISKDFRILWANRLITENLGDVKGKVCYSTLNNLTNVCPGCGVKEILETGKNKVVHEQVVPGFTGQKAWLEITAIPIRNKDGDLIAVSEMAIDITERKKAEEALRESEEKYRTVFENTGTATCILEDDKTISMANRRFEELSGYFWKELEGKKWTDFVTKEYLERMKRYHKARRKRGGKAPTHYSFDFVNKNGQIKNCLLTVNMIPGTKKSVASILDITELKKTAKALREAEEKYRETIVNANVGIICYGPEGEVKVLNPKMEQMTGFKRSEIPTLRDWFKKLYPNTEERRKISDKWFKRMTEEGEIKEGHGIITTKGGKRRNFLFNAVRLESGDSIALAEDITERKEAEEKLDGMMNELVTINEKLGVVGRLTRHDARNKLSVIANNVYLAKQKLTADHTVLEFLGDIESAVDQMEEIFDFARTYEMLGAEDLSYMNVEKSVDEAAILFPGLAGAKLMNECQGLTVMADSLLRQLFYNLVDNTLKHGEKVSQIRVYHEEGEDQLKLVYEDDGVGIPNDEKELIFKEGYGKGTGYGLYLIKKMCETYGWTIKETGKLGKGAQFTIGIPKNEQNRKNKLHKQLDSVTSYLTADNGIV